MQQQTEKALLVGIDDGSEECSSLLEELERLCESDGIEVAAVMSQKRDAPDGATFVGKGMLEEIKDFCVKNACNLLVFDGELTPTQQRNIERETEISTMDRTLLILDIFARRARSSEGRIQTTLARYRYLLPRLSGQGASLSRQGGAGMKRGAGESKLENDRRHIRRRIHALEEQLSQIEQRRQRLRERREKMRIPTVALIGYTNAGKSTLMNRLTEAGVLVQDQLFATLDPTARAFCLPDGRKVMLIDTVGLVRRLPHQLIDAFHSTLEEAARADVILNICDGSSPDAVQQLEVTKNLLEELHCAGRPVINVLNKCDKATFFLPCSEQGKTVRISAVTGEGIDQLLDALTAAFPKNRCRVHLLLPYSKGDVAARIRREGVVHAQEFCEEGQLLDCTIDQSMMDDLAIFLIRDGQ